MGDPSTLFASLIWGSIGFGFFVYGKKRHATWCLFGGVALMAISYFIESALYMSLAGAGILLLIFWMEKNM